MQPKAYLKKEEPKSYKEIFMIADVVFILTANFPIRDFLFNPQPYNLHINYRMEEKNTVDNAIHITFLSNNEPVAISAAENHIQVQGDFSPMFTDEYNKQFGLFGNKGILNQIILSTLEAQYGISTLHACAVIHPLKKKMFIAVGSSGAGKSAFVSAALQAGWKLIATEHVLISTAGEVFKGNQYDNVSATGGRFIKDNLKQAEIFEERRLVEPGASKHLVNLQAYGMSELSVNLNDYETQLVVLDFGTITNSCATDINDADFLLRVIQLRMSEKITAPILFGKCILPDTGLTGDTKQRTLVVNNLLSKATKTILLQGSYDQLRRWITDAYEH